MENVEFSSFSEKSLLKMSEYGSDNPASLKGQEEVKDGQPDTEDTKQEKNKLGIRQ